MCIPQLWGCVYIISRASQRTDAVEMLGSCQSEKDLCVCVQTLGKLRNFQGALILGWGGENMSECQFPVPTCCSRCWCNIPAVLTLSFCTCFYFFLKYCHNFPNSPMIHKEGILSTITNKKSSALLMRSFKKKPKNIFTGGSGAFWWLPSFLHFTRPQKRHA